MRKARMHALLRDRVRALHHALHSRRASEGSGSGRLRLSAQGLCSGEVRSRSAARSSQAQAQYRGMAGGRLVSVSCGRQLPFKFKLKKQLWQYLDLGSLGIPSGISEIRSESASVVCGGAPCYQAGARGPIVRSFLLILSYCLSLCRSSVPRSAKRQTFFLSARGLKGEGVDVESCRWEGRRARGETDDRRSLLQSNGHCEWNVEYTWNMPYMTASYNCRLVAGPKWKWKMEAGNSRRGAQLR